MNYLLTGATGFVGRSLADHLLQNGQAVHYLGRRRSSALDGRAGFHLWNEGTEPDLQSVPRLDAIVHLAGEPVAQRWTKEIKQKICDSRIQGTRHLVAAIGKLKHKPSVLVSASAIGFYGDRGQELLTESSAPGKDFLADVCLAWEREASQAQELGLRVALIRIAVVLGRNGGALKPMLPLFQLGLGGPIGGGKQWMSWIALSDLVRLLMFAAENKEARGALNASAPQPVTNYEFAKALGAAVHRPAILPVPSFVLRAVMGEAADFATASQRVLPQSTQAAGFQFQYPRIHEALRTLFPA